MELACNSRHASLLDGVDQVGGGIAHVGIKPRVDEVVNPRCVATLGLGANNQPMVKKYATNNIGPLIAQKLKARKKTYAWLADEIGVSINAVSKWVHTGQITLENAVLTAKKLQISSDELMNCFTLEKHLLQETQGVYEVSRTNAVSTKESKMISLFRQLDHARQDECIAYLEERLQLQKLNHKSKRIG